MSINRRDFLKLGGVSATMALTGINASASEHFEVNPDAYGMLVDTTLCLGENCRRCEEACTQKLPICRRLKFLRAEVEKFLANDQAGNKE